MSSMRQVAASSAQPIPTQRLSASRQSLRLSSLLMSVSGYVCESVILDILVPICKQWAESCHPSPTQAKRAWGTIGKKISCHSCASYQTHYSPSNSPLPPLQSLSHFHSRTRSQIHLRYDLNQPGIFYKVPTTASRMIRNSDSPCGFYASSGRRPRLYRRMTNLVKSGEYPPSVWNAAFARSCYLFKIHTVNCSLDCSSDAFELSDIARGAFRIRVW